MPVLRRHPHEDFPFITGNCISVRIQETDPDRRAAAAPGLYRHLRVRMARTFRCRRSQRASVFILPADLRRDSDRRRAAVFQFKMFLRNRDQLHVPVQTAVEGKVRLLRINCVVVLIADRNRDRVHRVPVLQQQIRQIHAEGGITPAVFRGLCPVHRDDGRHGRAAELNKNPAFSVIPGFGQTVLRKAFDIPAGPAVIVISAVLSVHGVPGVWQRHLLRFLRTALPHCLCGTAGILHKTPVIIPQGCRSHIRYVSFKFSDLSVSGIFSEMFLQEAGRELQ